MRRLAWLTGLGVGCMVVAGLAQAQVHVLTAERVHTSDPAHPVAQAIAWDAQGRILAVGGADDLRARYPDARRLEAPGKTVIPGLIDAHGHVMGLGYALMRADLVDARDKADVIARLREYEKQLPANA